MRAAIVSTVVFGAAVLLIIVLLYLPVTRFRLSIWLHKKGILGINQREAEQHLKDIDEVFSECGLEYFLTDGTALGAIREGRLIPTDTDIDIGVLDIDTLKKCALPLLKKRGLVVCRMNEEMITVIRNLLYIDIMTVRPNGYCVEMPCEKMMKFIENKQRVTMYGRTFWTLGKDYIEDLYGPSWCTPQYHWKPSKQ